jgi:biotin carboxyl carrier protein
VATNRDYLVEILTSDAFEAGETYTDFVDEHPPRTWSNDEPDLFERQWHRFKTLLGPHLAAAALFTQRRTAWAVSPWPFAPSGWRNVAGRHKEMRPAGATWRLADSHVGSAPQDLAFEADGHRWQVEYARVDRDHPLAVRRRAEAPREPVELFNVAIRGPAGETTTLVELIDLSEGAGSEDGTTGELLVHFGRRAHHCRVHVVDDTFYVNSALGQSDIVLLPRFPEVAAAAVAEGPVAPVPGRVVGVEVHEGDEVAPGQALVVLEAMKVEHVVRATVEGVVKEVLVQPGDNVEARQLLVRLGEGTKT